MRSWTTAAVIVAVWAVPIRAQSLNDLLDRMGAYLSSYEGELSQIIADERYDQRELLAFEDGATESVGRVKTGRISFDEIGESTLIRHMNRFSVKTRGQVWVDPDTGRVWRVEIDCRDPGDKHGGEGRATYRNFRRFQTSARIITPPPQ